MISLLKIPFYRLLVLNLLSGMHKTQFLFLDVCEKGMGHAGVEATTLSLTYTLCLVHDFKTDMDFTVCHIYSSFE